MNTVGGRELRSLLELLAIWSCHIWLVVRINFASRAANLSLGQGLLVYPILRFFLSPSRRSPDMTGILLTGTLNLNSTNQSKLILQQSKFTVSYHLRQKYIIFDYIMNKHRTI